MEHSPFGMRAVQDETLSAAIGVDLPSSAAAAAVQTVISSVASAVAAVSTVASSKSTPTSTPSQGSPTEPPQPEGECQLLGSFALIVQAALGALALLALVYKRWRERPQRPLKIWFFDVSKQVFGSVLVHIANIFMSMLTSGRFSIRPEIGATQRRGDDEPYVPNPCSFYLLNLAIDTTVGIPILIILLRILTGLATFTPAGKPAESIQSGNYGNPPNAVWWLKQSVIYFCGLFGMKICVLIIFILMPWISKVGDWALGWTDGNERLQIAFVMMIFPLIMNGLQYYIIDSFIKKKEVDHQQLPSDEPEGRLHNYQSRTRLRNHASAVDDSDSDSDFGGQDAETAGSKKKGNVEHVEYDPDLDGDASAAMGNSSSRGADKSKAA